LFVNYGADMTLISTPGVNLNVRDTDVNDDLSRNFRHRMGG